MAFEHCTGLDGDVLCPYYGHAPHVHTQPVGGTVFVGEPPANFIPAPDAPGLGAWYCPSCKEGMPNADLNAQQLMAELGPAGETIDTWPAWKQALVASRCEKQMEDGR
ncbi:hypothetical protein [Chromobacterium haemolyticum]|uniref:Uncharacterized protein n=1 Tax=Chromobacterium haemolyticum TaxID=394935 RepID=A0A1W0CMS9_9NEIS|nr:hypothetical protein [Chromobacterium haemolyticum]OQS36117.1 hypothetical protein B0T45_16680 [Chromobacterium haemolyticum]